MYKQLFNESIISTNSTYLWIKGDDCQKAQNAKKQVEELYKLYGEYLDRDFPQKLAEDFNARYWELYLVASLKERNYKLYSKQNTQGPDILVQENNNKIFIEAVTVSEGDKKNKDKVPTMETYGWVANDSISLRYLSSIKDKYDKYRCYLSQGVISNSDSFVIALNSCKIWQANMEDNVPLIFKTLTGIGDEVSVYDTNQKKEVNHYYKKRKVIVRDNKSPVNTGIFLGCDYEGLSGIFYSNVNICNKPKRSGDDLIFIHNPYAKNKIPIGYFNFGIEYLKEWTVQNRRTNQTFFLIL